MCRICGSAGVETLWSQARHITAEDPAKWSARGIAIVQPLLAAYGLELRVSPGDLRIATTGGRQARIRDLGSVWEAAEELLGYPLDPLSPVALTIAPKQTP
jgi:hypothetical protein